MEMGKWDFSPGLYYALRPKYSGSSVSFKLPLGLSIKFKESKSTTGYANTRRVLNDLAIEPAVPMLDDSEKKVKELLEEEVVLATDRNIDAVYQIYKDDFIQIFDDMQRKLDICLSVSGNKLYPQVLVFSEKVDLLTESVEYIHKTGAGCELENARRQTAYEDLLKEMRLLQKKITQFTNRAVYAYR